MNFSAKHITNIDNFSEKVHIIDQSLLKWTDLGALEQFVGDRLDKVIRILSGEFFLLSQQVPIACWTASPVYPWSCSSAWSMPCQL